VYNPAAMLRFLTAGESHGEALTLILEGVPAGLAVDLEGVDRQLRRRQGGYGRGQRMAIERDRAEVLSGIRGGETLGSPISLLIRNRDWTNWQRTMHVSREPSPEAGGARRPPVTRPRPGHADLAGGLKYDREDLRDVLERASARETAARVAAGAFARQLLSACGMEVASHVSRIGDVALDEDRVVTFDEVRALPDDAPVRCVDAARERLMTGAIDRARNEGDTLGGSFEVIVAGVPPGLGSHVQWDRKLDGRLAQALMSIPAIKAVGIGLGPGVASRPGSRVHDEIVPGDAAATGSLAPALARPTNRAGGLEGGITNGEDVRVTAFMKPIATLMRPLRSVDLASLEPSPATIERSDVCAVPAAAVVGEAMVALVIADAVLEKFGGDSMAELLGRVSASRDRVRARLAARPNRAPSEA
jgi:chorismate synthase